MSHVRTERNERAPTGVLFVLCAAVAVAAGWGTTTLDPIRPIWFTVSAAAVVSAAPFVVALVTRRFDIFEPVYLFSLSYAIIFVARPTFDLTAPGGLPLRGEYDVSGTYGLAMVIAVAGGAAFLVGYYSRGGRFVAERIPLPNGQLSTPVVNAVVMLGLALSLILFGAFLATTHGRATLTALLHGRSPAITSALTTTSGYLYAAPLWLSSLGILLLALSRKVASPPWMLALFLLGLSQVTTIGTGARSYLLPVLLSIVLLYFLRRQTRPRIWAVAGFLTIVFLVGVTLPRQYRNVDSRETSVSRIAFDTVQDPTEAVRSFFGGADTAMVGNLAVEAMFVPSEVDYKLGRTFVESLARPIPRDVWEGKPVEADVQLMRVLWPDYAEQSVLFHFSLFGEPFLNFGILGVCLFGVLYGVGWRALYAWFCRAPANTMVAVLYALNWPFVFVYMRGGVGVDYQRQLIAVAPALAIIFFARRSHRAAACGPDALGHAEGNL